MRELLFRGRRSSGRWVYGWYSEYNGIPTITDVCGEIHRVDSATVGQYTGLRDQNGKRIFEGDIVECGDYNAEDGYGEIIWDVDTARFAIIGHSGNDLLSDFDNYYGYELEVIGNIHDNPELLEEME